MQDWNLNTVFIASVYPPPQTDTVLYMAICLSVPSSPQWCFNHRMDFHER